MGRPTMFVALAWLWPLVAAAQPAPTQPASQPATTAPAVDRILSCVPDDTHLLIVVPSLERCAGGIAAFGKAIGVADMAELTARQMLSDEFGDRAEALRVSGPLVLALSAEHMDPLILARLETLEPWTARGKVTALPDGARLVDLGDEGYLAVNRDDVVILAREKEDLQRALQSHGDAARRLIGARRDWLDKRQVQLCIDVPAWNELLGRQMNVILQGAYIGMAAAGPEAETSVQVSKWMFEQLQKLLTEARTVVLALQIDAQGVSIEQQVAFRPDGEVARYLQGVRKPPRDLLRGLTFSPTTGALFACEWELAPGTESIETAMVRAMMRMETLRDKLGGEKLDAAMKRSIEVHDKLSGYSIAFGLAPETKNVVLSGLYLSPTAPGAEVLREMRGVYELSPEIMNAWGGVPSATITRSTERIGEAEADVYNFTFDTTGTHVERMGSAIYGKDSALILAPHPEGVIYAMGPRAQTRDLIEKALTNPAPRLREDARVAALLQRLSPDPQFVFLADVPQVVGLMTTLVREVGVPVPPLQLGDKPTALAGVGGYLEKDGFRFEAFVPSEPIKLLTKAIEKADSKGDEH